MDGEFVPSKVNGLKIILVEFSTVNLLEFVQQTNNCLGSLIGLLGEPEIILRREKCCQSDEILGWLVDR